MMVSRSIAEYRKAGQVFVVAEVAQAHDGSLGILHSFIDACATTGVDAIKFQVHIAEAESSPEEPFRLRFSYVDATRFDYWRRMELSPERWAEVRSHCDAKGLEFLATPFSCAAVDLLQRLGVQRYKIGSGDIANALLLEAIARTGKEAILSTGLATAAEIGGAVDRLRRGGVAVLQCTTRYPTQAEEIGLEAIPEIERRFGCPAGLSDHSGTIWPGIAATALGAAVVEAHVAFDRRMFGPDAKASLVVDDFARLVEGIRFVEKARGGVPGKEVTEDLDRLRTTFGRSLAVVRDLPEGHAIGFEDLECKKPAGIGLPARDFEQVLGRRLRRPLRKWEFLKREDIA
jgi:N-acetylneuraminate synthase